MTSVVPLIALFDSIVALSGAICQESRLEWRADQVRINSEDLENRLTAALAELYFAADLKVYGEITGPFDPFSPNFVLRNESISVVFSKSTDVDLAYFLTSRAFADFLQSWPLIGPKHIRLGDIDTSFLTEAFTVAPWDETLPERQLKSFVSPRRFVRDQTSSFTPTDLSPRLTPTPIEDLRDSTALVFWKDAAAQRLAYVIPYEIREVDKEHVCVLKGPRSAPIEISFTKHAPLDFTLLHETAVWIYTNAKDAETKFAFVNYHLPLDWPSGRSWLQGLCGALKNSLESAKDAFAFYLQDQAKDALKSLADLRKSLQEEVSKTRDAIKDTINAIWRDFAVAGVVLVLKTPIADVTGHDFNIESIEIVTAILLSFSGYINIWAIRNFIKANNIARAKWRPKIYAFISEEDWTSLVENPLAKAREALAFATYGSLFAYVFAISYLIYVASVSSLGIPLLAIFMIIAAVVALTLFFTDPLADKSG